MKTFSDEHIERCAERFIADRLHLHGVTFAQYVAMPERYEALALEPWPLLPQQAAVRERLIAEEAQHAATEAVTAEAERGAEDCPRRNGALVEALAHHRYPRRPRRQLLRARS